MNGVYLKIFVDSLDKYRKLNDAEFGRLIRAALQYKATGEEVNLMGREELLWDGMKLDIDRDNQKYIDVSAKRSEAGAKGAKTRWQNIASNSKNSKCHLPYSKNGQDKDKDKDKDKDNIPHTPKGVGAVREGFEGFWALYPRKVGKKDALRAWEKLPKCVELQSVLDSLSAWMQSKQWTKDDGEFIPYPATFLNKELWKEVPPTASQSTYAGKQPVGTAGQGPLGDLERLALARLMQEA